jgi:Na+-driven multidrug efflux pump
MLPLAYVLSIYFHEGVIGICLAGLFSRMIEGAILLQRWYYMKQRSHLIEAG